MLSGGYCRILEGPTPQGGTRSPRGDPGMFWFLPGGDPGMFWFTPWGYLEPPRGGMGSQQGGSRYDLVPPLGGLRYDLVPHHFLSSSFISSLLPSSSLFLFPLPLPSSSSLFLFPPFPSFSSSKWTFIEWGKRPKQRKKCQLQTDAAPSIFTLFSDCKSKSGSKYCGLLRPSVKKLTPAAMLSIWLPPRNTHFAAF